MDVNKDNVRLWVDALRSGAYVQTTGQLRDEDGGYCCLGVACEISGLGEWSAADEYLTQNGTESTALPPAVRDWLGLGFDNPELKNQREDGEVVTAISANDDLGWTFEEIADAIERKYLV